MTFCKRVALLIGITFSLAAILNCAGQSKIPQDTLAPSLIPQAGVPNRPTTEKISQLGDPAPALTVLEWVKGGPVKLQPGTNFYAVVFCTLSRAGELALTNLTSLQQLYRDKGFVLVVISDDAPDKLKEYVQSKGAAINFAVAADDLARKTTSNFQRTFGQFMLPRAYVVGRDGKVLWLGHPLREGMGQVVDDIATGRYNLEQTKKDVQSKEMMDGYLAMARQDDPRTVKAGHILLRVRTNDAPALCDLAFQIATAPYIQNRDVTLANAALDRAAQLATTNATDIAVDRAILLFQTGKQAEGLALARKAQATAQSDADKSEVATCIRAMETRIATDKASQTNAPAGK